MQATLWNSQGNEIVVYRDKQLRCYRWGQPQAISVHPFRGELRTIGLAPDSLYGASSTHLYWVSRSVRGGRSIWQKVGLPTRDGEVVQIVGDKGHAFLLTERGSLLRFDSAEGRIARLELSKEQLVAGDLKGDRLAVADGSGRVWVIVVSDWRVMSQWSGSLGGVADLRWGGREPWLVGACADGLVKVWEPTTGKALMAFVAHRFPPRRIGLSEDGSWMVSYGEDGLLIGYDLKVRQVRWDWFQELPSELGTALALRCGRPAEVWVLSSSQFGVCELSEGKWRYLPLK